MKKLTALVVIFVFVLSFIGCAPHNKDFNNGSSVLTTSTTLNDYEFKLSYAGWTSDSSIFTSCLNNDKMSLNGELHCPIFKIDTKKEFDDFKTKYGDILAMESRFNDTPSFADATSNCDEKFFNDKTLFVVYVTANSGSYRYEVESIYCDGDSFDVHVKQSNNPEAVTMDMAGWLVTVTAFDEAVKNCTYFDADLNNPYGFP